MKLKITHQLLQVDLHLATFNEINTYHLRHICEINLCKKEQNIPVPTNIECLCMGVVVVVSMKVLQCLVGKF